MSHIRYCRKSSSIQHPFPLSIYGSCQKLEFQKACKIHPMIVSEANDLDSRLDYRGQHLQSKETSTQTHLLRLCVLEG